MSFALAMRAFKLKPMFSLHSTLGRTGFAASKLGIGDLADSQVPFEQLVTTARRALGAGLNLIDTAPGYEDGLSERVVGAAIRAHGRDQVFVIDKIDHFDRPVRNQVEASLLNLGLTHTDAFAFHGVSDLSLWQKITAPGGLMDELMECRRVGKTRFVGVSSHHPDVVREAILGGKCDLVMFAVGPFVDDRYVHELLPLAREKGVGTVCFKTFGAGKLLGDTEGYQRPLSSRPRGKLSSGGQESSAPTLPRLTVEECLHYTLTLDPDVALLGMSFPNEQDAALAAAATFRPLDPQKMEDIRKRAKIAIQDKGPVWWNPPTTDSVS
jgi:1-deoxyxylulose-5-phosphate synthase